MTPEVAAPDPRARLAAIGAADLVVGVPGCGTAEAIRAAAEAVARAVQPIAPGARIVVAHPLGVSVDEPDVDGAPRLLACALAAPGPLPVVTDDPHDPFRSLFTAAAALGARACALVGAPPEQIGEASLGPLLRPVLDLGIDLALPCYVRHRFDLLINTGIVYPLMRALHGRRVRCQIGVDFAFSERLFAGPLQTATPARFGRAQWFVSEAACAGLQMCQSNLGTSLPPPPDGVDVSTVLAQVLGSLFLDVERTAACWQRTRGSQPVQTIGSAGEYVDGQRTVDTSGMVESFRLGYRNLQGVWGRVLPPATLLELSRLTRADAGAFRLPDALWARIVYDFALGHRLRVINRDHLLKAMTPAYLAWAASFVGELGERDGAATDARVEQLCAAFEAEKPYLVSRWRWPDRFNP